MVVDLQQNVETINVTMSCPWSEQPQQLRLTPKKDRRKPKVPAAAKTLSILRFHCCPLSEHVCDTHRDAPLTPFLCRCQASLPRRIAAMIRTGSAGCTHSPAQPGVPSALGVPRAVAGSLRRSRPPLGRGELTLCPPHHRLETRCPLQLCVSKVFPSHPCPCRSHFSLEVKLNSSSGLLFYVAGERGTSMALFISNGRFVFLLHMGRRRLHIRSKDKYRDQRWHTVSEGSELRGPP